MRYNKKDAVKRVSISFSNYHIEFEEPDSSTIRIRVPHDSLSIIFVRLPAISYFEWRPIFFSLQQFEKQGLLEKGIGKYWYSHLRRLSGA
ncbi:hypothetical protein Pat9b_5066 (plasmid) [Pantoea sp. At-9b]|jgi:hypothetical protein|nr:hypothetical protein Pat9b_5066 [Pantoea sp. At-9b]